MRVPNPEVIVRVSGDKVGLDIGEAFGRLETTRAGWRQICAQVTRLMNLEDLAEVREVALGEMANDASFVLA